jgi:hypothetical protein
MCDFANNFSVTRYFESLDSTNIPLMSREEMIMVVKFIDSFFIPVED